MFPDAETTAVVAEAMVPLSSYDDVWQAVAVQEFEVLFSLLIGFAYNSFFGNSQVDILNTKLESLQRQLEFKLDRQEVKLGGKIDRQEVKLERLIAKLERMDRKWMR